MESPASIWIRSGRKPQYLFKGSRDEIIQELKAWVERRRLKNQAYANSREEFMQNFKSLMALPQQSGSIEQNQTRLFEIMTQGVNRSRVSRLSAMMMLNTDIHRQELADEKDIEALHGQFLVATVTCDGIAPPDVTRLKLERVDADIFSILDLLDETFDGRKELEALAERDATAKWQAENAVRDANHADEIAQGLVPGMDPGAPGVMPAQARQGIPDGSTLSMAQAITIASEMHLGEGIMQLAMGRATPDTIAQMLEMIRVAEISSPNTTAATNSTPPSANYPTTVTETAATTSTSNMSQDQSAKPTKSKAKKKNDARKARKKAQAKEAAVARKADGAIVDAEGNDDVEVAGMD